jgi:ABC-type dipeptide/oligopeptide/nickel transport system permease component
VRSTALDGISCLAHGLPQLVAAAFLTEIVFAWRGIGRVYWNAITQGDGAPFIGVLSLTAFGVIAVRFVAEAIGG